MNKIPAAVIAESKAQRISRLITELTNPDLRKSGKPDVELASFEVDTFIVHVVGTGLNGKPLSARQIKAIGALMFGFPHLLWDENYKLGPVMNLQFRRPLFTIDPDTSALMWLDLPSYRRTYNKTRHRAMRPINKSYDSYDSAGNPENGAKIDHDTELVMQLVEAGALKLNKSGTIPTKLDVLHMLGGILLKRPIEYDMCEDVKITSGIPFDVTPKNLRIEIGATGPARIGKKNANYKVSTRKRKLILKDAVDGVTRSTSAKKHKVTKRYVQMILKGTRRDPRIKYVKRIDRKEVRAKRIEQRDIKLAQWANENGITWTDALASIRAVRNADFKQWVKDNDIMWDDTNTNYDGSPSDDFVAPSGGFAASDAWLDKWKQDTGRDWDEREAMVGAKAEYIPEPEDEDDD